MVTTNWILIYQYTPLSAAIDILFIIIILAMLHSVNSSKELKAEADVEYEVIRNAIEGGHVNKVQSRTVMSFVNWTSFIGPGLVVLGWMVFAAVPTLLGIYITVSSLYVNYHYKANATKRS